MTKRPVETLRFQPLTLIPVLLAGWAVATLPSVAGTYNWGNTAGGNWSVGANWGGTAPTGADSTDVIRFELSNVNYTSTDDVGTDPFLLQQLTLGGETPGFAGTKTVNINATAGQVLKFSNGGTLELAGNLAQVGPDDLIYNVSLNSELAGDLNITGNGLATFNMAGIIFAPATMNISVDGSARAVFSGGPTLTTNLNFTGGGTGGVTFGPTTIQSNITVSVAASPVPRFGALSGTGNLTKTGAGRLDINGGSPFGGYSGNVTINQGMLKYNFSGTGPFALDLGSGNVTLDGATLDLNFQGVNWGASGTFANNLIIGSSGGTIDIGPDNPSAGQRRMQYTFQGTVQLDGNLTIAGNGGVNDSISAGQSFTNTVTLSGDRTISNATTQASGSQTIYFKKFAGNTRTLTLAGGPFAVGTPGASDLDVRNIVADANLTVERYNGDLGSDPLDRLTTNGGTLTMKSGRALTLYPANGATVRFTTSNVIWENNTTLSLARGSWDSNWIFTGNQIVGGSGAPATMIYNPFRGGLTVNSGSVIVTNGGVFRATQNASHGFEAANASFVLKDGAVLEGANTVVGGLARSGGTMTLGDGTPSSITIRGSSNGAIPLQIGYGNNLTDSGNVTLNYASTGGASSFFNVAWTASGNPGAATVAFREGSAGTVFSNANSGATVAAVGPAAGTVFTATKPVTIASGGTVGFYNGSGSARSGLGPVLVSNTVLNLAAAGVVQASSVTFTNGATLSGVGTVAANVGLFGSATTNTLVSPGDSIGTLSVTGDANFGAYTTLALEVAPTTNDLLNITGNVDLSSTQSNVLWLTGSLGSAKVIPLVNYDGSLVGTFEEVYWNGVLVPNPYSYGIGGYSLSYGSLANSSIALVIPEPATLLLVALGGVLVLRRRRRI